MEVAKKLQGQQIPRRRAHTREEHWQFLGVRQALTLALSGQPRVSNNWGSRGGRRSLTEGADETKEHGEASEAALSRKTAVTEGQSRETVSRPQIGGLRTLSRHMPRL